MLNLSIDLLGLIIHDGGTIIDTAKAGIYPRIKKDRLDQRGLPFPAVTEGPDITNVTWFNSFHCLSFLSPAKSIKKHNFF